MSHMSESPSTVSRKTSSWCTWPRWIRSGTTARHTTKARPCFIRSAEVNCSGRATNQRQWTQSSWEIPSVSCLWLYPRWPNILNKLLRLLYTVLESTFTIKEHFIVSFQKVRTINRPVVTRVKLCEETGGCDTTFCFGIFVPQLQYMSASLLFWGRYCKSVQLRLL